jgi:hypothetical protein
VNKWAQLLVNNGGKLRGHVPVSAQTLAEYHHGFPVAMAKDEALPVGIYQGGVSPVSVAFLG